MVAAGAVAMVVAAWLAIGATPASAMAASPGASAIAASPGASAIAASPGPAARVGGAAPAALRTAMPPTKAWVLVDADTGNIISARDDHAAMPPASLTKVITALAAVGVAPTTPVTVSPVAAAAPADKIDLKAGQVWTADELFHAMLISSANDAAVAMAEQVGGSLAGFKADFTRTAQALGMVDHPVLLDPAGLDGRQGVDGGNRVSARDLAIAGRALLSDPYLTGIVSQQVYRFAGPDGALHTLVSHDRAFLASYTGAVGIKTGFTDRAGTCLMAAAQRDGRTMLAVMLSSANTTVAAKVLLDQGFATPVGAEPTADALPPANLDKLRQAVAPSPAIPVVAQSASSALAGVASAAGSARTSPNPTRSAANGRDGLPTATATGVPATDRKFGALAIEGVIALLLCLGTMGSTRLQERQVVAPNLWQQNTG